MKINIIFYFKKSEKRKSERNERVILENSDKICQVLNFKKKPAF